MRNLKLLCWIINLQKFKMLYIRLTSLDKYVIELFRLNNETLSKCIRIWRKCWTEKGSILFTNSIKINCPEHTLISSINVQSWITVQGEKLSIKNKRTGQKTSAKSVQVSFFQKMHKELEGGIFCSEVRFDRYVCHQSKLADYHWFFKIMKMSKVLKVKNQ